MPFVCAISSALPRKRCGSKCPARTTGTEGSGLEQPTRPMMVLLELFPFCSDVFFLSDYLLDLLCFILGDAAAGDLMARS